MKRIISLITSFSMIITLLIGASPVKAEEDGILSKIVNYELIEFGYYPQTEIVSEKEKCGTYGKAFGTSSDYVEDSDLYLNLMNAQYDSNGDTTIDNVKYHRIKRSNATTYAESGSNYYYNWSDDSTYHYFRYDPIKWRVIDSNGDEAFLLSEIAIDNREYNKSYANVTWETCTLRNWLNSDFLNSAFSSEEQSAIIEKTIKNSGDDTTDKIFLLSDKETYGEDAIQYGFSNHSNDFDIVRQSKSSTYAKAMGAYSHIETDFLGNCHWWLRSPGSDGYNAVHVNYFGLVNTNGNDVSNNDYAIRPALHLNLKVTNIYKDVGNTGELNRIYANELSIIKHEYPLIGSEVKPKVSYVGLTEGKDFTVSYSNNDAVGTATITVQGIGKWSGTITKIFRIVESIDISSKEIEILDKDIAYNGEPCCPKIQVANLILDQDYTVSYTNNIEPGIGTVTVSAKNDSGYTGSISKTFTIGKGKIETAPVVLDKTSVKYTGEAIAPVVTIEGLTNEIDYTVRYINNINAGNAEVIIQGIGKYEGTITKYFTINPVSISDKKANLSRSSYTYNGSACKPTVSIGGLKKGTDYTVSYKNNTKCGKATATITGIGNYKGTIAKTFVIGPAKAKIAKATAGSKSITVKINSQKTSGVTGYQIYYKKAGGSAKTVTTTSTSKKLAKLTKGKKYTVKVRAYKTIDGKKVYGEYSTSRTVKVK